MERIPKGIYTPEFRAEAVNLWESTGVFVARAAKQLSVPKAAWTTGATKARVSFKDRLRCCSWLCALASC
jgi:transposase